MEPYDKYITNIQIRIYYVDDEGEELDVVGYGEGYFFEADFTRYDEGITFYELCDMVSQASYEMAGEIVDNYGWIEETFCDPYDNIYYLDKFYIKPKYRNLGIGKYVINYMGELLEYICRLSTNVIILNPTPIEEQDGTVKRIKDDKEYKFRKKQLVKFYKSCGFKEMPNKNHMFKNDKL